MTPTLTEKKSKRPSAKTHQPDAEPGAESIDALLADTLEALGNLIAFDQASVLELDGERLRVRAAAGEVESRGALGREAALGDLPECAAALEAGFCQALEREESLAVDAELGLARGTFALLVPLVAAPGDVRGLLRLERTGGKRYSTGWIELCDVFGRLLGAALAYGEQSVALRERSRVAEARSRYGDTGSRDAADWIEAAPSAALKSVRAHARRLSDEDGPVLLTGEAGSGKTVLARAIHHWSSRRDEPFVSFSCSAHEPRDHERELFGDGDSVGRLAAAQGGTLYLRDVELLSGAAQTTLVETLADGARARVIASLSTELPGRAPRGFREDLYFALASSPIQVPPLRARKEDVRSIATNHLDALARETGDGPWELSDRSIAWLEAQDWPGNVHELCNVLDRATILSTDPKLDFTGDPLSGAPPLERGASGGAFPSLREMEKRHIERVLRATHGQIYGPRGAADLLEINPNTLRSRMKKLGLGGARSFRKQVSGSPE